VPGHWELIKPRPSPRNAGAHRCVGLRRIAAGEIDRIQNGHFVVCDAEQARFSAMETLRLSLSCKTVLNHRGIARRNPEDFCLGPSKRTLRRLRADLCACDLPVSRVCVIAALNVVPFFYKRQAQFGVA